MAKIAQKDLATVKKSGWIYKTKKLHKSFEFPGFAEAFGFMAVAALGIEKRDHHPEWTNVYNKIAVSLSTHDAGDVTAKDLELAKFLDHSAARFLKKK